MKERPILFSAPMIRALLDNRKTQTRRAMKPQPPEWVREFGYTCFTPKGSISGRGIYGDEGPAEKFFRCPYGQPRDRLWCKETCIISHKGFDGPRSDSYNVFDKDGDGRICQYLASTPDTDAARDYGLKVSPSIFMPRWASRITLEITEVRVARLNEMSDADVLAEGVTVDRVAEWCGVPWSSMPTLQSAFSVLWESINGAGSFDSRWVWALTFRRVEAPE